MFDLISDIHIDFPTNLIRVQNKRLSYSRERENNYERIKDKPFNLQILIFFKKS